MSLLCVSKRNRDSRCLHSQLLSFVAPFSPISTEICPHVNYFQISRRPQQRGRAFKNGRCEMLSPREKAPVETSSLTNFFIKLGLTAEDTGRILAREKRFSSVKDIHALTRPMLEYLMELGLSEKQLARVLRNAPQIFFKKSTEFSSRLRFLEGVARVPESRIPAVIAKCPHVLWMNIENAKRVVEIILDTCPVVTSAGVGSIFAKVPQVLIKRPAAVQRNIDFIRESGVGNTPAIGRVVSKVPLALVYDIEGNMAKKIQYFREYLDLAPEAIGKLLLSTPEVLEWSLDKFIKRQVKDIASIVGEQGVASVIDKVPSVLATDCIRSRVEWLKEVVGLTDDQIQSVVQEAPAILSYSVRGNLAPKWAFVQGTMGGTPSDVVKAPREVFCANLQQRAVPRFAFLASSGIRDVPVVDILHGSDVEFCKNVAKCDPSDFRRYVDDDTYLLFFSQLL